MKQTIAAASWRAFGRNLPAAAAGDAGAVARGRPIQTRRYGAAPEEATLVSISLETTAQTDIRLRKVIRSAALKIYDGTYSWLEFPLDDFPRAVQPDALALVRDDEVWSQLVPHAGQGAEPFAVFRFHFPPGVDNSGFVGWLASHMKQRFGTGVFVTCGQNSRSGGIYDYWGCPAELGEAVIGEVHRLTSRSAGGGAAIDRTS